LDNNENLLANYSWNIIRIIRKEGAIMEITTEINNKLSQLCSMIPEIQSEKYLLNFTTNSNQRDQIAQLKKKLHQLAQSVEKQAVQYAETYRQKLGDGKDTFEAMDLQAQVETNQEAFEDKQAFGRMQQALDMISLLQGSLLDLDDQIEQKSLGTHSSAGSAQASVPIYDQDPAPPTVSP
jgi:HAMP domain-containing protein